MDSADFYLIVAPLGVLVFLLTLIGFYYGMREEKQSKELQELRLQLRSGVIDKSIYQARRRRIKNEEAFARELERLQKLLENNSIDEETYRRLKKLLKRAQMLEAGYEHVATDSSGRMHFRKRPVQKMGN
ncbi:MAG: hypothetical protein JSV64_01690 [Candidatus Bathyarchaeota archaeon]|nr:MAG: hypothetical protein JSV64_01690 [Candidatus Bathyarchaeota archaeon]